MEYFQLAASISETFYDVYKLKMNVNLKNPMDFFLSYFTFTDERIDIFICLLFKI